MWGRRGGLQMESFTAYAVQEGQLVYFVISKFVVSFGMIVLPRIFSISYFLPEMVLDLGVDCE